jgi:hypothetical protein
MIYFFVKWILGIIKHFTKINHSNEIDYIVEKQPKNGLLTVTGNVATYTPNTDFLGEDSFTYIANNGVDNSEPGVISITILDIILTEGLVAYYPFDGDAKDISGNGNNGIKNGDVGYVEGVIGKAAKFSGISNPGHIRVPNSPSIQFNNEFSVSFFVRHDNARGMDGWGNTVSNGYHCVFAKSHDRRGFFSLMNTSSENKLTTYLGNSPFSVGGSMENYQIGSWLHIAYVINPNGGSIYINGILSGTKTNEVNVNIANNQDLYFGKYSDSWYPLNGTLDEVYIYNRALSEDEIQVLYQMNGKISPQPPVFISFISEFPQDYAFRTSPFVKEWQFKSDQDISGLKTEIIDSDFTSYTEAIISQKNENGLFTVQIELKPETSKAINKINLQFKNINDEIVKVNKSDKFWSIIRTNHLPEIDPAETFQSVGQSGTMLEKEILAFDKDGDELIFSVIGDSGRFEGNRIQVQFDSDGVHTIQIKISDGKEFITKTLNILTYGENGGIKEFYSDVTIDHHCYNEIMFDTLMNTVWGDVDPNDNSKRNFNPEKYVNWAEALKMVLKSAAIRGLIELPTSNYLQPDNYEKDWYWAKPYYTFARKKKAVSNGIKFSDLPTREEIGQLIVASLDLIIPKEFSNFDLSFLVFSDKEKFSENYLQFATTARLFNLFFTTNEAKPGENVKRDDLAMVISKILRMPTGEIDSEITVEYGDNLIIHGIKNLNAAKIMNLGNGVIKNEWIESPEDYIKTSIVVNRDLIINEKLINGISPVNVSTKGYELGQNHIIAIIQNTDGARNILTKEFNITFIDSDFDGIQDREDLWPDDSRYSSDINNNGIPDILDIIYALDHLTVNESLSLSQTEIPIAKIIEDGKIDYGETDCPRLTTWARNQSTGECKAFLTPCDIINGWIIDKECFSPVDFNRNNDIDLSDLIIALKILSGMEQENIQIQINERIELEDLILILNSF